MPRAFIHASCESCEVEINKLTTMSNQPREETAMDQTATKIVNHPPLPPHAPSPTTDVADGLGRAQLSSWALQELERTIHDMHPAYQGLVVSTSRKSKKCYVLNVRGEGVHHCLNKGSAHRRSNIYFVVYRSGVCQKCFAGKGGGCGSCASFRFSPAALPGELQEALFGS